MPHLRRQACCFAAARSPCLPTVQTPKGPAHCVLIPPTCQQQRQRSAVGRTEQCARVRACLRVLPTRDATRRATPRHGHAIASPVFSSPPRPRSLVASRRVASRGGCTQRTHGPWVVAVVDLLGAGRDRPAVDATHAVTQSIRRGLAALLAWRRGGGGGGRSKCQRRRQEQDTAAPGFAPPCRASSTTTGRPSPVDRRRPHESTSSSCAYGVLLPAPCAFVHT